MKNLRKRLLFTILSGILLLTGGVFDAYGQTPKDRPGPLKTLQGRILWEKSMGVLPSAPRSIAAADNICAQFFVVAVRPKIGDKPIQYDIHWKPNLTLPSRIITRASMKCRYRQPPIY